MSDHGALTLGGTVPGSELPFRSVIRRDMITLRVGDRVCIAGPAWMSVEQVARLIESLQAVTA